MSKLMPVILAGGAGTRLWPLSRELYPKQFLTLYGDHTMIQHTLLRLDGLPVASPYVVCNEEHRFLVAEQCRAIGVSPAAIILEPEAKNTAPAIALAAFRAVAEADDAVLVILAADHYIGDVAGFQAAVSTAVAAAERGQLLTFGVVPSDAETGYGYIHAPAAACGEVCAVAGFVEKPDEATAEQYFASGEHFWNSGMFVFQARAYLDELAKYQPSIHSACEAAMASARCDLDFIRPGPEFCTSPTDSIDYAVMERTDRAAVLPVDFGWSDLGSWRALSDVRGADAAGNVVDGDVISVATTNSFVHADNRLVATLGVDNMVVVETADAVLVAEKDAVQDVKAIVENLRRCTRSEHHIHQKVYRPWGSYESVESGARYQVKRITVKPGASLSLQMHHHRSEHWIVVTGTAEVQRGEETFLLSENESTYIPLGARHRLSNPGKVALELIEVQVGAYLGEDDIERFDDVYGRAENAKS